MALVVIRIEPPWIKMNIKNLKSEYRYLTVVRKKSTPSPVAQVCMRIKYKSHPPNRCVFE